jgi:hypothetical protein
MTNPILPSSVVLLGAALGSMLGVPSTTAVACEPSACAAPVPTVELAICLDTSGSMDGLIESAKQKLWAIVNDLGRADPTPRLRVALLTYGNDGHEASEGWVQVATPFTEDLDVVSERLFALSTNGGTEYVGRVLQRAGSLDWSPSPDTLKLAVVAGNESAEQDPNASFRDVCRSLIARGIQVNSIYCGSVGDGIVPAWREIAGLAEGKFASIDQQDGTLVLETPYDVRLGELSIAINATYIPYGTAGAAGRWNQTAQDANAASLNSAAVAQRCATKGSALYSCGTWDLVDACKDAKFDLAAVAVADLPETMRPMTVAQRRAHVEAMALRRAELRAEITVIGRQRESFVQEEIARRALDASKSFDFAVREAVRSQAQERGFTFKDGC